MKKVLAALIIAAVLAPLWFAPSALAAMPEKLPSKRACLEADLTGVFHLKKFYHFNAEAENNAFKENKIQYLSFMDSRLADVKPKAAFKTKDEFEKAFTDSFANDNLQYLLSEEGIFYLYKDREYFDAYYCFISGQDIEAIKRGDILLQKSTGDNSSQVLRVYERYEYKPPEAAKPAEKKKKRKKRRKRSKKKVNEPTPDIQYGRYERIVRELQEKYGKKSPYKNRVNPEELPGSIPPIN